MFAVMCRSGRPIIPLYQHWEGLDQEMGEVEEEVWRMHT
jgi:hypothetical protein